MTRPPTTDDLTIDAADGETAADLHEEYGATFTERGGKRVVASYTRTERTHRAVRGSGSNREGI